MRALLTDWTELSPTDLDGGNALSRKITKALVTEKDSSPMLEKMWNESEMLRPQSHWCNHFIFYLVKSILNFMHC